MFKTIFWGNSEFVLPTLEVLKKETHLLAIITGLDKPIGRRLEKIKIPEPKEKGLLWDVPVFQPATLKDAEFVKTIQDLAPDLMVVISYGKIIKEDIYSIPPLGTINLHASLLPQYRGASPIQQSLLKGDGKTGVSIQKINDFLDEGNLLLTKEIIIEPEDHYPILRNKLAHLSAEVLKELLHKIKQKEKIEEKPQIGTPSFCKKITKEQGLISWQHQTAQEIYNHWRGLTLWPGIHTYFRGKVLKLQKILPIDWKEGKPGQVLKASQKEGLIIKAKEGAIQILEIQPENKKNMEFADFLNGYSLKVGDSL